MALTPHNEANFGDFAPTVLMPGDPLRSKWIAENFLEDAKLVNNVRGIQGYTGTYKGKRVSVMASGMGMPSIGIYSYELFRSYGVRNIIRVGTTGAYQSGVDLGSVIIADRAYTNTNFDDFYIKNGNQPGIVCADGELADAASEAAERLGIEAYRGCIESSDTFYCESHPVDEIQKHNILAVEMEAAALFLVAKKLGTKALTICSVSDNIADGVELSPEDRQTSFKNMIQVALEIA